MCIAQSDLNDPLIVMAHAMACARILNGARRRQLSRLKQWIDGWERGEIPRKQSLILWPTELADLAKLFLSLSDLKLSPIVRKALTETLEAASQRITTNPRPSYNIAGF